MSTDLIGTAPNRSHAVYQVYSYASSYNEDGESEESEEKSKIITDLYQSYLNEKDDDAGAADGAFSFYKVLQPTTPVSPSPSSCSQIKNQPH